MDRSVFIFVFGFAFDDSEQIPFFLLHHHQLWPQPLTLFLAAIVANNSPSHNFSDKGIMFKSLGNMIFGDSSDEGSSGSLKRGVPTNVALVYGKSTYELEFTDDDFASEERPEKGVTVLSLKFIASRILTPKILTNNTANNGASTAAAGAAGSGNKLINPSNFTLIHHGKKLLDDKKYLVDYKIKNGDKILVMVSNPERVAAAAAAATRVQRTEKKTASASKKSGSSKATSSNQIPRAFPVKPLTPGEEIQKILDQLDKEILPLIQKFISHPPESESARKEEHHRISE